jgi:hypothetical protein
MSVDFFAQVARIVAAVGVIGNGVPARGSEGIRHQRAKSEVI